MKKKSVFFMVSVLALALVCAVTLAVCGANQTGDVLEAWTGKISEENRKNAIAEYLDNNYTPFTAKGDKKLSEVTFRTDYIISSCKVIGTSRVENNDIEAELNGGIYLIVDSDFTLNRVTVSTDWWYDSNDWTNDYPIWSYLVCVEDIIGNEHYYYFRTDYSS